LLRDTRGALVYARRAHAGIPCRSSFHDREGININSARLNNTAVMRGDARFLRTLDARYSTLTSATARVTLYFIG
jgi:hypothetical protein